VEAVSLVALTLKKVTGPTDWQHVNWRKARSLATLVVLAVFTVSTTSASAQQLTPPDAAQLYAQMTAAMQQAGSVHVQQTTATLPAGPQQTIRQTFAGSADVSPGQQLLRIVFTTKVTSVRTHQVLVKQRTQFVAVDGRYAQRNNGGQWYCQTLPPEYWQGIAFSVFTVLPMTPHFVGSVASATVLGAAVWRVPIDLGNRTEVLNIAQDSYRLVRITEVRGVKTAADGRVKIFTDFSRYGEPVTAQLPQACG
jgi:hypothetical protein